MTLREYTQEWFRHDGDNPAIAYYEDYSIAQLQEVLATLTPTDLDDVKEWGITDIANIEEWRDAISVVVDAKRAAQGATP